MMVERSGSRYMLDLCCWQEDRRFHNVHVGISKFPLLIADITDLTLIWAKGPQERKAYRKGKTWKITMNNSSVPHKLISGSVRIAGVSNPGHTAHSLIFGCKCEGEWLNSCCFQLTAAFGNVTRILMLAGIFAESAGFSWATTVRHKPAAQCTVEGWNSGTRQLNARSRLTSVTFSGVFWLNSTRACCDVCFH